MKDYEDEAFDDIEKAQQRKVTHGVTDGSKKDAALRLARKALKENHYYMIDAGLPNQSMLVQNNFATKAARWAESGGGET